MSESPPGWIGLAEGLAMVVCAGVAGALAFALGAGTGLIIASAVIASVAGKVCYQLIRH